MQQFEINASKRVDQGKGASRRLRRAGMVPGILYGAGKAPQSITVGNNDMLLHLEHEAFYSHILTVSVDGSAERVVLKDLQRHPFRPILLHVDFQRIDENKKLTMRIPLHFLNEESCVGVKANGGVLSHLASDIEIECLPKDLPEFIAVDVVELQLGDILHAADLKLPANVEIAGDPEQPVVSCHIPKVVVEETAAATTEAAAGETPAAVPAIAQKEEAKPEAKAEGKAEAKGKK
jgi:large subunit ribosomal protein L25